MAQPDFHNMDCGKCNPYYSGDIQVSQSNKILKKTVIEPKPELQAQLDAVAKQCKIKSMVKLRISDSISSPVTYGFFKPVVLFQTKLLRMKSLILLRRMNVVISKTKIYG